VTHRLAFVGSCQVTGMRAATTLLRPDIEIEAHHVGAHLNAQQIADRIMGYDTVVTQIGEGDANFPELAPSLIEPKVGKLISIPIFVFSGLHPDMIYIFRDGGPLPGAFSDMHSLITVSGYLLGLSEERTKALFNAFIFSELGYFAAYEASYPAMVDQFTDAGYDMRGQPERWIQETGSFMYTINHPAISVLSLMALESLKRAGLVSQDALVPTGVDDYLHSAFVAPVFSPLARRIGIREEETFLKPVHMGENREVSLAEYIAASYAIYRDLPVEALQSDQIRHACEKLRTLLH
jgi:hypothetical protein